MFIKAMQVKQWPEKGASVPIPCYSSAPIFLPMLELYFQTLDFILASLRQTFNTLS